MSVLDSFFCSAAFSVVSGAASASWVSITGPFSTAVSGDSVFPHPVSTIPATSIMPVNALIYFFISLNPSYALALPQQLNIDFSFKYFYRRARHIDYIFIPVPFNKKFSAVKLYRHFIFCKSSKDSRNC